ncbi:hypothetical protein AAZX31_10G266500 [Glycine max]
MQSAKRTSRKLQLQEAIMLRTSLLLSLVPRFVSMVWEKRVSIERTS